MASKVMVKIPVAPFGKVNKKSGNVNSDIVVTRTEIPTRPADGSRGPEQARIAQLEQNIKFLQEQHQLMLTGLHNEIENLKTRNRELQFQLVFVKGTGFSSPSSPSSPEDDTKHKVYASPKPFNTTPLQVEILEKELTELKLQTQETESRNAYLSAIVDEQKKKLERYERDREKERERAGQPDPELLRKLDDAEAIIRRLRRENSDLRREHAEHCSQQRDGSYPQQRSAENGYTSPRNGHGQHSGRGNGGRQRGNSGHYRGNWFPPLHSQSYWQSGRNHDRSMSGEQSGGLPSLQGNEGHYQSRRGSNNNHYNNGENRKYRGGQKNGKQT
ncbi:putative uncharacterized protein DDB_G0279653 [Diabrotica virgifera virgifera]|uniref:CCDC92/74 N-terminal domain-containing protein n=1 Tax=Diabrotica virgifera virgifera TaxID=50390 RepID=A0A6P7G2K4_DIAVI|nr:putative uncharacterized protein DDB_G0279653 [Diabrotica virgifera virgifera]